MRISRKVCPKIGTTASYQFSRKTCYSAKLGFEITFMQFQPFRNIFKIGLPPWFYKNNFQFKNHISNFYSFFFPVKSNNL